MINNNVSINQVLNDTFGASFYRPALSVSFFLDASLWSDNTTGYHLTNIFIHVISSVLLFIIFYKLKFSKTLSFIFALIFISSPILTPSVAWISGRNDSLLALFAFASFIFLINSTEKHDKLNNTHFAFSILFFAFAVFTKESAIVLPGIFYFYLILIKGEKSFSGRILQFASAWILIIILFFVVRSSVPIYSSKYDIYGIKAILMNILSIPAILGKIFLPVKMSGCAQYDIFSISTGILFIIILIILPVIIKNKFDSKFYYFGLFWFLLTLFPTLFVKIHLTNYDYLEHRSYLPMAGLFISIMYLIKSFNLNLNKNLVKFIISAIIIIFTCRTIVYSATFKNTPDFWTNNVIQYPENFQGYFSLGRYYFNEDSLNRAETFFNKALEYGPDRFDVYQALGAMEINKANYKKAEMYALKSLELDNENIYAYTTLSTAYIGNGKYNEAVETAKKGISFDREQKLADLYNNLGMAYNIMGKYKESIEAHLQGIKIDPKFARGYSNLAASYYAIGDVANSIKSFYSAIALSPMLPEANNNLIRILISKEPNKALEIANAYKQKGGKFQPDVIKLLGW